MMGGVPDTFPSAELPLDPTAIAEDGLEVRELLRVTAGSTAHFQLTGGRTGRAVRHLTIDEVWYVVGGRGEMWRRHGGDDTVTPLRPGTCVAILAGTSFQVRSFGRDPLEAIAFTSPPWPGEGEAVPVEDGKWAPDIA
jgi:mannose-6-phosphate isomerase-like protein (cupin superfamily)